MPYIKQEDRERAVDHPENAGELNFAITTLVVEEENLETFIAKVEELVSDYVERKGVNHTVGNEVVGVFMCAAAEVERRGVNRVEHASCLIILGFNFYYNVLAPYEDQKIKENGDVYPSDVFIGN